MPKNNPTLFERAKAHGQASCGLDGQPMGCVIGVYGDDFRPSFCGVAGSKLHCRDCWARKYGKVPQEAKGT